MLSEIIGKNKILLHQLSDNWETAITMAAQPLLDAGYIEPRYITAMIDSVKEYGPYIVIAKGVALAHARSENGVNKMGLSVMTLKNPINFGNQENDPVQIVFCLAAPDATTHLYVMRALVNVINEEWKIQKIAKADTVQQFVDILNQLEPTQ